MIRIFLGVVLATLFLTADADAFGRRGSFRSRTVFRGRGPAVAVNVGAGYGVGAGFARQRTVIHQRSFGVRNFGVGYYAAPAAVNFNTYVPPAANFNTYAAPPAVFRQPAYYAPPAVNFRAQASFNYGAYAAPAASFAPPVTFAEPAPCDYGNCGVPAGAPGGCGVPAGGVFRQRTFFRGY